MENVNRVPDYKPWDAIYDWKAILDGNTKKLVQGIDFTCTPKSMRNSAKAAADRRRLGVSISVRGNEVYVRSWGPAAR